MQRIVAILWTFFSFVISGIWLALRAVTRSVVSVNVRGSTPHIGFFRDWSWGSGGSTSKSRTTAGQPYELVSAIGKRLGLLLAACVVGSAIILTAGFAFAVVLLTFVALALVSGIVAVPISRTAGHLIRDFVTTTRFVGYNMVRSLTSAGMTRPTADSYDLRRLAHRLSPAVARLGSFAVFAIAIALIAIATQGGFGHIGTASAGDAGLASTASNTWIAGAVIAVVAVAIAGFSVKLVRDE